MRQLLSMRRTVASVAEALERIGTLRQLVKPLRLRRHGGRPVIVAHSLQFEQEQLDLECSFAIDVESPLRSPAGSTLVISHLPAVERMAVCVRAGPPNEPHLVTARTGRFLEQNGDALAGASRKAFLPLPDPHRMQEAVVEMKFPLA